MSIIFAFLLQSVLRPLNRYLVNVKKANAVGPHQLHRKPVLFKTKCLTCWFSGLLASWFADLLASWFAGVLACWLSGLLTCWLADLLT